MTAILEFHEDFVELFCENNRVHFGGKCDAFLYPIRKRECEYYGHLAIINHMVCPRCQGKLFLNEQMKLIPDYDEKEVKIHTK